MIFWAARRSVLNRRLLAIAGLGVLAGWMYLHSRQETELLGNYLDVSGAYSGAATGLRSNVVPPLVLKCLTLIALLASSLLAHAVLHNWRAIPVPLRAYSLLATVGSLTPSFMGQSCFDRYILPMLLPAMVFAAISQPAEGKCSQAGRWMPCRLWATRMGASAALVLMAGTTALITGNALSFDAARWQAASDLVAQGASPTDIDAGLEWVGYHSTTAADVPAAWRPGASPWTTKMFHSSRSCFLVSASDVPGTEVLRTLEYRKYGLFGSASVIVSQTASC